MIVDIGEGATDMAVISLNGIAVANSCNIAGASFNDAIVKYVRKKFNLIIGDRTAEEAKIAIGCAYPRKTLLKYTLKGRNAMNGLPETTEMNSDEMIEALIEPAISIVRTVQETLEATPPELLADIFTDGIYLTGGSANLYGFSTLLSKRRKSPLSPLRTRKTAWCWAPARPLSTSTKWIPGATASSTPWWPTLNRTCPFGGIPYGQPHHNGHFRFYLCGRYPRTRGRHFPAGRHPRRAARIRRRPVPPGYGKWLIPSGGVSVKKEKWPGVSSKADVYTGDYHTDCAFFIDVLRKNGVPASAIVGEFQSGHTRDNAFLSRQAVGRKGPGFPHGPHRLQGLPRPALPDALPAGLPRCLRQGRPGALLQHHQGELVQDRGGPPPGAGGAGPVWPPVCG